MLKTIESASAEQGMALGAEKHSKEKILSVIAYCIAAVVLIVEILPYVIFGTDCFITIHDNLDWMPPFAKLIHEGDYFFDWNARSNVLNDLQSIYFISGYTLNSFIYFLLEPFEGYVVIYAFSLFLGFFSMRYMLRSYFEGPEWLVVLVSLAYAILPVIPDWRIAVASLPLVPVIYKNICTRSKWFDYLAALLFPFISHLNCVGLFICAAWFIVTVILSIKRRKLQVKPLVGLLLLGCGYLLFNVQLVYLALFSSIDLNRSHYSIAPKSFFRQTLYYLVDGYPHVVMDQQPIIVLVCLFIPYYLVTAARKDRAARHIKKLDPEVKVIALCLLCIVFNALMAGLDESKMLDGFISTYIPPLSGFHFSRFYILNKVLWYVVLFLILQWVAMRSGLKLCRPICFILAVGQVCMILVLPGLYNDSLRSWKLNLNPSDIQSTDISYREFYDEDLFERIKEDIGYQGEKVAAVGFHPNVLIYNDFSTVDGYWSYYPYEDMIDFRRIIAPELEENGNEREYYDSWGGRRYLYCSELSYAPTRTQAQGSVRLNIDSHVFTDDFDGRYLLSRAPIANAAELGFDLVETYSSNNGIYTIYLYRALE